MCKDTESYKICDNYSIGLLSYCKFQLYVNIMTVAHHDISKVKNVFWGY